MKNLILGLVLVCSTAAHASEVKFTAEVVALLASRAAAAAQDDRTPQDGQCTTEARTIKCTWALPTNYTDDTLNAVFSIEDGSVIDVQIEPGC